MTDAERRTALEEIAAEVRVCTKCRLHQTRTRAVPGEGDPDTEVIFVGEGPGFNEDREGRPFVGRAGGLLVKLLAAIGWRREDVFITNVVKCRPPDNRDPQPDEIAACAPYLRRQLEVLDPAVVVTELAKRVKRRRVAIVGHEPDLGELAAALLGAKRALPFRKGAVCRIDVDGLGPTSTGTLIWFLPPKILRKTGR